MDLFTRILPVKIRACVVMITCAASFLLPFGKLFPVRSDAETIDVWYESREVIGKCDYGYYRGPMAFTGITPNGNFMITSPNANFRKYSVTFYSCKDGEKTGQIDIPSDIAGDIYDALAFVMNGKIYLEIDHLTGKNEDVTSTYYEIDEDEMMITGECDIGHEGQFIGGYYVDRYGTHIEWEDATLYNSGTYITPLDSEIEDTEDGYTDGYLFNDISGIYDLKDMSLVVDYGRLKGDFTEMEGLSPLITDDDGSITMVGIDYESYPCSVVFVRLTKASVAETRKEIRVGIVGYPSSEISEAINIFNDENEEYYVLPVFIGNMADSGIYAFDESPSAAAVVDVDSGEYTVYLSNASQVSEVQMERIMNDHTLDAVISDGMIGMLRDGNIMADMNDFIDGENGIERDTLFENILGTSECGGALYQIPVRFYLSGIADHRASFRRDGSTNYGRLSYEGYKRLLANDDQDDPMLYFCDGIEYTEELISSQYDDFVDRTNGTYDFQNESFYELLRFVKESIQDRNEPEEFYVYYDEDIYLNYDLLYCLDDYMFYGHNRAWYGLPSSGGSGIGMVTFLAAGIPRLSDDPEAGWIFIRYLMTEAEYSGDGFPISCDMLLSGASGNRDAYEYVCDAISHVDTCYVADQRLRFVCSSAIEKYFNGLITEQEAAEIIEDNMNNK